MKQQRQQQLRQNIFDTVCSWWARIRNLISASDNIVWCAPPCVCSHTSNESPSGKLKRLTKRWPLWLNALLLILIGVVFNKCFSLFIVFNYSDATECHWYSLFTTVHILKSFTDWEGRVDKIIEIFQNDTRKMQHFVAIFLSFLVRVE